ncbi:Alpha-protein kinase vwkA [Drechslerella dactyloides]|uniref:Alpha-protein kinase vwkA n=1 Tax=Drechslerella dactyloides TaxID=74499 RepID=A0AAD6J6W1_DREDA|nr:Alpha-protein kinase vwkA [Drechslerella dactyloides]
MASLPPYSMPTSVSRSATSPEDIRSMAELMLRTSIREGSISASSTATTRPRHSSGSRSSTGLTSPGATVISSATIARYEGPLTATTTSPRSYDETALSATEQDTRLRQLKYEMRAAEASAPRRSIDGLFKAACSTDLLFLIDTTGSMAGHIQAAKNQVRSIVADIEITFLNQAEVRIAVVGYKDHGDSPNVQFLDFTPSAGRVHSFLDELTATGGNDTPEDVLGGIRQALNATWKHQTRCIVHIADAPPHGRDSHDLEDYSDHYPNPGSEPHTLTYKPLLQQMVGLKINYALLRINSYTDRMALNFLQIYAKASAECRLHESNAYYSQLCSIREDARSKLLCSGGNYRRSTVAGLVFDELELGIQFSALRHLVVQMVASSASRTASRMSGPSKGLGKSRTGKRSNYDLAAINEDEDNDDDELKLETETPQWNTRSWFDEMLAVEGFSPDVVVHGARTLDTMMAHDDNIKMGVTELTIHKRLRPFAQGAMRVAFYARTAASHDRFVVKSFKKFGKGLPHLAEDMRCQALCKAFALEFNALSGENHAIDFIVTTCLKGKPGVGSEEDCMSLEPFIHGDYIKYNNNCGYINQEIPHDRFNLAAQAFSHFTFERSRGGFLVSDLQGVGHLLTDPAIRTRDPERFKLSETNLGEEGFKFFFATHACNDICKKLQLQSNASMVMTGRYRFRGSWPTMDNTVCCSNKLCGRIVPLNNARKSDGFPGYHWCDSCWPQLASSKVKRICVGPGPHHEFEMSLFFYESQGRKAMRMCSKHRNKEDKLKNIDGGLTLTSGPLVVDDTGQFWNQLKSAARRKSISSGSEKSGSGHHRRV